jgi:hypothetical protein
MMKTAVASVRVIVRSMDRLARLFPEAAVCALRCEGESENETLVSARDDGEPPASCVRRWPQRSVVGGVHEIDDLAVSQLVIAS